MKNKNICSAKVHERADKGFGPLSGNSGKSLITLMLFLFLFSLLISTPACAVCDNKYILFAHGMGANSNDWDTFADYAENAGYTVFRTNVSACGSVESRSLALANYINTLNVPDHSIVAVGHSMGGIDLRRIVGEAHNGNEPFLSAARKIKGVYTIVSHIAPYIISHYNVS